MREKQSDMQGLIDLIDSIGKENLVMIEIGSFAGESAEIFVNTRKIKKLICIDPWEFHDVGFGNSYPNIDCAEQKFDTMREKYADKITKFKGTIDTFIQSDLFKQNIGNIDLVYIDGLHTYEGCLNDIKKTLSVIKPNLAISGHDYADQPAHIVGVKKAVNEIFGSPDKIFCDTSWIKFLN